MNAEMPFDEQIADIYRGETRRVFATLLRLLGDFDLAEEALHEAFAVALERWPADGLPRNPRGWLTPTGRFKGIHTLRRRRGSRRTFATARYRR